MCRHAPIADDEAYPAGPVPMTKPDLRAKKNTKPSYETPARIFRAVARRQARAAAEAALAGVL